MPSRQPSWISGVLLSGGVVAYAQDAMPTAGAAEKVGEKPGAACLEPPPLVGWQDYNGPFAKTVGTFGRKLERKAVHPPRYRPGVSCAPWNRELNSCCSYTTALTRFRYLPLDSMPGWTRPLMKTLVRARRDWVWPAFRIEFCWSNRLPILWRLSLSDSL